MSTERASTIEDVVRGARDWHIEQGDARAVLERIPDESVQCVITSPPYWGLRDYGIEPSAWGADPDCAHEWSAPVETRSKSGSLDGSTLEGTGPGPERRNSGRSRRCVLCGAWLGVLGLEPTPEQYVANLVEVFRALRRVLRPDGTVWLNLGDSYCGYWGDKKALQEGRPSAADRRGFSMNARPKYETLRGTGLKPKDLIGMPWHVAFALRADGWWLRRDVVWSKPNGMPESVRDRPSSSHEYLFLLTKRARYFYDADAIREPDSGQDHPRRVLNGQPSLAPPGQQPQRGIRTAEGRNGRGRNKRSVWTIATEPFPQAHFATFPKALVEEPIRAGTSEKGCCPTCGAPWRRTRQRLGKVDYRGGRRKVATVRARQGANGALASGIVTSYRSTGWEPSCDHGREPVPCLVLDPFAGAGTAGLVALRLGRRFLGIELSTEFCDMARRRIEDDAPLLNTAEAAVVRC